MNSQKDQLLNYQDHQHVFQHYEDHHDFYFLDYNEDQLYHIPQLNHQIHVYVSHALNLDLNPLLLLLSLLDFLTFID
jgi:hypothetical protein